MKVLGCLGGVIGLLIVACVLALFFASSRSVVSFDPAPKVIGASTPVAVNVRNSHGVRRVQAWLEQDGRRTLVFEKSFPSTRLLFWRKHEAPQTYRFNVSAKKDGRGRLIATVVSNDFRGASDTAAADVEVITRPPAVFTDGFQHYINQGGSELVVFTPSGYWDQAGVRVGKYTFRAFRKPGGQTEWFSLFAFPWDAPADAIPVVFVRNAAGTEVTAQFTYKLFPKSFRKRDIELTDAFLQKAVGELDPGGSGDLLTRFLKINGEMRRKDNRQLADMRLKTADHFLWNGPFLQLANSKVESQFADVRSYIYHGKKVDQQVHLGFDLSVTQHVPVVAANDGRVVHADRLGIYGNCIVLDHGYGLQSIYGHMSDISVKPGDMVKKGQVMGHSGSTGLAAGDHLHFSMQVDGVQVNPVEWWDQHWIQDRVWSKIPPPSAAAAPSQ
jgi:murein DD-endopeptidase MepM/ murein hydrolase activator NlpD